MKTDSPNEIGKASDNEEAQSDHEDIQAFSKVLAAIRQENIVTFCIRLRERIEPSFGDQSNSTERETATLEPTLFGSYHALFSIKFHDEDRWILKVPVSGTRDDFDSFSAAALKTEALTMRLIQKYTSIPVPKVFAFDSFLDSELGSPLSL